LSIGVQPAPVTRASRHLRAAKGAGPENPESFLQRADEVIE
jgi:hypothetical protein